MSGRVIDMQKRLACNIFGRVQMVMYRDFVQRAARKIGVVGIVRNMPDGNVFVVAEGEEEKLKEFFARLKQGPLFARVERVEEEWSEPLGGYKTFDILY